MVYINGQDWAVDAAVAPLSDCARARIAAHGPYTQDFARVFPILQPHNCETFMDELLGEHWTIHVCARVHTRAHARARARAHTYARVHTPTWCSGGEHMFYM